MSLKTSVSVSPVTDAEKIASVLIPGVTVGKTTTCRDTPPRPFPGTQCFSMGKFKGILFTCYGVGEGMDAQCLYKVALRKVLDVCKGKFVGGWGWVMRRPFSNRYT